MLSMKAASSITSSDTASDLAASALEDLACILEPFFSLKDSLFFSTEGLVYKIKAWKIPEGSTT